MKRTWKPCVVVAALLTTSHPADAQLTPRVQADRTKAVLSALQKPVDSIRFKEERLQDVLDWHREQGLSNIVVRWRALEEQGIARYTTVSLELFDVSVGEVLTLSLEQASQDAIDPEGELFYVIRNGIVHISTRADFVDEVVTKAYNPGRWLKHGPLH